jgi:DNA-binding transcriptional LysR family regulator
MSKTRGLAQDLAAGIAGRVRLQMVTSVTEFFMPALVGKWDQQAPGLALEAEVSHPLRQLDALRRSRCDVALIRRGPSDDQFAEHLVMREPLVVIFPAIWRKNRTIMQLSDLSREAMVSLGPAHGPGLTSDIDLAFQKAAFEPTVAHVTDSMDTLLALVAAGIGWSVVPASLIRRHPDDLGVLHNAIQETTDLVALVRSDDDHPAVQRFLTVAILVGEQVSNTVRQAIMKHRESYKR